MVVHGLSEELYFEALHVSSNMISDRRQEGRKEALAIRAAYAFSKGSRLRLMHRLHPHDRVVGRPDRMANLHFYAVIAIRG